MNQTEILKSAETVNFKEEELSSEVGVITKAEVESIYNFRQQCLEQVRSVICLKFYDQITEKLLNEKQQFEKLLNWQDARDAVLSHYSFVLNSYYFEQKFIESLNT